MGADSKIEWCRHTFNAWIGCEKCDPCCDNCYAESETFTRVQRSHGRELWGADADRHITSPDNWRKPLRWNAQARRHAHIVLRVTGRELPAHQRWRVFVNSLSDVCEDRRDLDAPREWLWELIRRCEALDFMLLTKRPQNIGRFVPQDILDRVFMGVTAGTQAGLKRVRLLMRHRAYRRFVSMEPLLEDVDFDPSDLEYRDNEGRMVDLVIVGGESGANARTGDLAHHRAVIEACRLVGVAVFHKQAGASAIDSDYGLVPLRLKHKKGGDLSELPEDLRVRQMPEVRS